MIGTVTAALASKSSKTGLVSAKTVKNCLICLGQLTLMAVALSTTPVSNSDADFVDVSLFFDYCVEFLAATMDASVFTRESYLRTAFTMLDTDGSGKIDATEL